MLELRSKFTSTKNMDGVHRVGCTVESRAWEAGL